MAVDYLTHVGVEHGLPSGRIISVFPDKLGFIWIATPNSTSIYDGLSVKQMAPKNIDLEAHEYVFGKALTDDKMLLSIGYRGLYELNLATNTVKNIFKTSNGGEWDDFVSDFIALSDGQIFIATDKLLVSLNNQGKSKVIADLSDVLTENDGITQLLKLDNYLLVATTHGLFSFSLRENTLRKINHDEHGKVFTLSSFLNNHYIGYENVLAKVSNDSLSTSLTNPDIPLKQQILGRNGPYLFANNDDNFYIGNSNGVHIVDQKKAELKHLFTLRELKADIASRVIHSLALDHLGRLWIGTEADGVIAWDPKAIDFRTRQYDAYDVNSLQHNHVWDLAKDQYTKDGIWVASSGGIDYLNTQTHQITRKSLSNVGEAEVFTLGATLSNAQDRVSNIEQSSSGNLWFRRLFKVEHFEPDTEMLVLDNRSAEVGKLLDESEHKYRIDNMDRLWAVPWASEYGKHTIFSVDLTSFVVDYHDELNQAISVENAKVRFFPDLSNKHEILISVDNQLVQYNPISRNVAIVFSVAKAIKMNDASHISAVVFDKNNNKLWIGVNGLGLFVLDGTTYEIERQFIGNENTFQGSILGILQDVDGNIWVSSKFGLTRITSDSMLMQHYDSSSGLPSDEFVDSAAVALANGVLVFGNLRGVVYFNPSSVKNTYENADAGVYFADIDEEVFKQSVHGLNHQTNISLSVPYLYDPIAVTVVSPLSIGKVKPSYTYTIEGGDSILNGNIQNQRFTLPSLGWGDYDVKVSYMNPDNGSITFSQPLKLTVEKPMWMSLSAWIFYCGLLLLMMFVVARLSALKLRAKNHQVNLMVRKRTEELEVANKTKDRFLANMSHEIRTPLTTIMGFADSISNGLVDNTQMPSTLRHIKTSSTHLLNIIDSILDLNKLNAETFELVYQDVSLTELIDEVVLPIRHMAENKGLVFSLELSPSLPEMISTDETRLKQVLLNICGNAIKFTDHGQITVAVDIIQHNIVITVVDSGIGICEQDLAILFAPFERGKRDSVRYFDGTGLGLDISKRICDAFGGNIAVTSDVGLGSRFTVVLPLILPDLSVVDEGCLRSSLSPISDGTGNQIVAVDEPPSNMLNEAKKLLIVDDFEVNIDLLKLLLKSHDVQIVSATSGLQALQILETDTDIGLVLMDIQMPHMDGIETFTQLRAWNKLTPVLAFTANNMTHEIQRYMDLGFDGYVSKPIVIDKLLDSIRQHL